MRRSPWLNNFKRQMRILPVLLCRLALRGHVCRVSWALGRAAGFPALCAAQPTSIRLNGLFLKPGCPGAIHRQQRKPAAPCAFFFASPGQISAVYFAHDGFVPNQAFRPTAGLRPSKKRRSDLPR